MVCYISSSVIAKRREDLEVAGMEYLGYVSHMQTAQDIFFYLFKGSDPSYPVSKSGNTKSGSLRSTPHFKHTKYSYLDTLSFITEQERE